MIKLMAGQIMAEYVVMAMFMFAFMTGGLSAGTPSFACSVPHCNTTTYYGKDCKGCQDGYSLVKDAVWYRCKPHCLLCLDNHYFECSVGSSCNYCCRDPSRCIYELDCSVCPNSYSLTWGTPGFCYPSNSSESREWCEVVVEPTPVTTTPHDLSRTTTKSDTGDSDHHNTDAPTFACSVPHCATTTCSGSNCTGCESGYTLVNNAVWYGCDPHCLLCRDSYYFECSPGSHCNYCCDTDSCDISCTVCPDNYYLGPGTPRMCYPCLSENGDPTACDSLVQTNIRAAGAQDGTQGTTISGATGATHPNMEAIAVMTIVLYMLVVPGK